MRVSVQVLTFCCCVKNRVMIQRRGMGQWWDHYQSLSSDEKLRLSNIIGNVLRRAVNNVEANESKDTTAEIEPLVNVPEARSRRAAP